MPNYKLLLESLNQQFHEVGLIIACDKLKENEINCIMKKLVHILEKHTGLDFYNQFADLYD